MSTWWLRFGAFGTQIAILILCVAATRSPAEEIPWHTGAPRLDTTITQVRVKLRPAIGRATELDTGVAARLSLLAGLSLSFSTRTRDGGVLLDLPQSITAEQARGVADRIRQDEQVVYAEPVPSEGIMSPAVVAALAQEPLVAEIIVRLRDAESQRDSDQGRGLTSGSRAALSAVAGMRLLAGRSMSGGAHVLRLERHMQLAEAQLLAERLEQNARVEYAEPVRRMKPELAPNDPYYAGFWNGRWYGQWPYWDYYGGINLEPAWDITTGSSAVVIGIIDTGLLPSHPDLLGRTVGGYDMVTDVTSAGDGNGRDGDPTDPGNYCGTTPSDWHGTHVAGTIGASSNNGIGVAGVNWVSKLLPVRALGRCSGSSVDVIDSIRWAAGLSVGTLPLNSHRADVINMSLGTPGTCSTALQAAINDALGAGASIVVAAGNDGQLASQYSPASCSGVIVVHATNRLGGHAYYSNYGSVIDISAPGGDERFPYAGPYGTLPYDAVLSTIGVGMTSLQAYDYIFYQGTSMAAPYVSGVVSLIRSRNRQLSPAQVKSIIENTAWPFPIGTGSDCTASVCGAGIVDAGAALLAVPTASPSPTPTRTPTPTPTKTPTPSPSPTPTKTPTPSPSPTPTKTPVPTASPTPTPTKTPAPTPSPTPTKTPTPTPSPTPTPTKTPVPTASPTPTKTPTPTAVPTATPIANGGTRDDLDGDGKTDIAVYDGATGNWLAVGSSVGPVGITAFGGTGFKPTPGDYDGDGLTDAGIYEVATGTFYYEPSGAPGSVALATVEQRYSFVSAAFVPADWLPAPADYDGDGTTDFAWYNSVTGEWSYRRSSNNVFVGATLGGTGFLAIPADFDADGKADVAVYQVSNGAWTYVASATGLQHSLGTLGGGGRFAPVPADYDGDGIADLALYQKKKGKWRFRYSKTGASANFTGIGGTGWLATPGDFDGDGACDAGAYRKSTGGWRYKSSQTGQTVSLPALGGPGLIPVVGLRP